jgi:hypothetical protein
MSRICKREETGSFIGGVANNGCLAEAGRGEERTESCRERRDVYARKGERDGLV